MRIFFRQSGGLLGTPRECDTANLDESAVREAEELLKRAGVHGSLDQTSSVARDATRYELTITNGDETTRLVADDATVPSQLLPLIEFLRKHSRPVPLKRGGAGD
jgi:Emfourin